MTGKYETLTHALRAASERGQHTVEMSFDEVGALVGGLPQSAMSRQWWANSSHSQALAWRAAGYHVSTVPLDRRRVRFEGGPVGGTYADRGRATSASPTKRSGSGGSGARELSPVGDPVDVRVVLQWTDAGQVVLDTAGKPTFIRLPPVPGLYRITMSGAPSQARARVYIGESADLARRLSRNYRNPGSSQQTSLRINARLREHLGAGGVVALAIATRATAHMKIPDGAGAQHTELDLSRKASRLLAENAALVLAHHTDDAEIENLP